MASSFLPLQTQPSRLRIARPGAEQAVRDPGRPRLEYRSLPDPALELQSLLEGLRQHPARIDPKYFYDAQGGALFAAICRLQEYYLTRTEAAIFARHAEAIAGCLPRQGQWVDLGCGDAEKSLPWIAAADVARYIGVDIAEESLALAVNSVRRTYPQVACLGVVADFCRDLDLRQLLGEQAQAVPIFFYPGSSLGNFSGERALSLLRSIRSHLADGGYLLIGVDLLKDVATMTAAYDDALGLTAAFNKNSLRVVNRLLAADFDPARFDHQVDFDAAAGRIEMRLRARCEHVVRLAGGERRFAAGETILTEYAHKYRRDEFAAMLDRAGFSTRHLWTDADEWFGVFLASP